jgi:protein SCO1
VTPTVSRTRLAFTPVTLVVGLGAVIGAGIQAALRDDAPPPAKVELPKINTANAAVSAANTLGFPQVKGGDFKLVDHHGKVRTSRNPAGHYQFFFFGYAKCKAICTTALPAMADAVEILEASGVTVSPLLITVDPGRDTIAALREEAPKIHPSLVGLTGSGQALDAAYKAFKVEKKFLFDHLEEGPIYTHGSFIYLLDADGQFKTLFPPIMSPKQIATVTAGYINNGNAVN